MSDEAARFRQRARECRDLAANSKDEEWQRMLFEIAFGLEEEADHLDAEGPSDDR